MVRSYDKLQENALPIKYSNLAKIDPFRNLQITAEKLANRVAINECLLVGHKADVIIISCGRIQNIIASLSSVRTQGYAVDKVFILIEDNKIIQDIGCNFKDLNVRFISHIYQAKKLSKSGYIQFMLSGDEMDSDKIASSMTAIYQYNEVDAIYFNGILENKNTGDVIIEAETTLPHVSGKEMLSLLRERSIIPSGGMVGFLLKRHILIYANCFEGYELDGNYLYWLGLFHILLQCKNIAIISDKAVKSIAYTDDIISEYVMQLEVAEL